MQKIKKYILTFIFMLVAVMFMNNYTVLADGEELDGVVDEEGTGDELPVEPPVDTDQFVVVNPDGEGNAKYKIEEVLRGK